MQASEQGFDNDGEIIATAFRIYGVEQTPSRRECLKSMAQEVPGLSDRQYASAWNQVHLLFEQACKMAFRWANENPAGAEIDLDTIEHLFLDELAGKCQGFTREQYRAALVHGFDRGIF